MTAKEDRAFIFIKHQGNPSLLPSKSAVALTIYVYFYVFIMSLSPAVKEAGFFQECINPGDQLM